MQIAREDLEPHVAGTRRTRLHPELCAEVPAHCVSRSLVTVRVPAVLQHELQILVACQLGRSHQNTNRLSRKLTIKLDSAMCERP